MALPASVSDSHGPSLLSIPVEVLLGITRNLTTPELGSLRRSCKHIESTLFPSFSREFFTKRQFMFTEFSLQVLVDISKSRMSSRLSHVIFSLQRPSPVSLYVHDMLRRNDWHEHVKSNRLVDDCFGQMTLLNTGQDVEMLVEAFSNMSNLETVGIRDFNSPSRHRDAPHKESKSTCNKSSHVTLSIQMSCCIYSPALGIPHLWY